MDVFLMISESDGLGSFARTFLFNIVVVIIHSYVIPISYKSITRFAHDHYYFLLPCSSFCRLFSFFAGLRYLFLPRLRLPICVPVELEEQVWQTKGKKRFTGDEKADEWVCGVVFLLHFF